MSIKSLGKQSLIYGVGHVVARSVTFLLLPLYTNIFSLEDYRWKKYRGIPSVLYFGWNILSDPWLINNLDEFEIGYKLDQEDTPINHRVRK